MSDVLILEDLPTMRRGRQAKPLALAGEMASALKSNVTSWISNGETYETVEEARSESQKYQRHFADSTPVTTRTVPVAANGQIVSEPKPGTSYKYRFFIRQAKQPAKSAE